MRVALIIGYASFGSLVSVPALTRSPRCYGLVDRLPWRVVLGSATTGALPKKFEAVFNSEGLRQSV